jgi:hypothetical protein
MRRLILPTLWAWVFAGAAGAQEAVILKLADPPRAGDRVRVTETETSKTATDFTILGKKQSTTEESNRTVVYVQEVLTAAGKDDRKPLKLKRTYEKYEAAEDGKDEAGPPLNVAILIEKKGDKYAFDAGEKKLDADFAAKLDKEFNKKDDAKEIPNLLPAKPVKPGDTWKVRPKWLFGSLSDESSITLDADKGSAGGKLLKVYRKGDRRFAVFELTFAAPITSVGKDSGFEVKEGRVSARLAFDVGLDPRDPFGTTTQTVDLSLRLTGLLAEGTISCHSHTTTTEELLNK